MLNFYIFIFKYIINKLFENLYKFGVSNITLNLSAVFFHMTTEPRRVYSPISNLKHPLRPRLQGLGFNMSIIENQRPNIYGFDNSTTSRHERENSRSTLIKQDLCLYHFPAN